MTDAIVMTICAIAAFLPLLVPLGEFVMYFIRPPRFLGIRNKAGELVVLDMKSDDPEDLINFLDAVISHQQ